MTETKVEKTEVEEILDIDIDAKAAQLREAAGKATVVKLRGKVLSFDPPKMWSTDALEAANEGDLGLWAKLVLGDDVYADATVDGAFKLYELEAVFEGVGNKNGMEVPKSGNSGPRSKKRPKR